MKAHIFQHVSFEGLGALEPALRNRGCAIHATRFYADARLPDPAAVDFLVVLGGPMSVNDEAPFPWLVAERKFIRHFLATGKPVLGICLGAQLIASALGARVFPNHEKEIGWFPVTGLQHRNPSACCFPESADVFHWHGETFELPPNAVHLARSRACAHQAFQFGTAVGLQFHLETTPATARALIENARANLVSGPYIQSEANILAVPPEKYAALHGLLEALLDHLLPLTADARQTGSPEAKAALTEADPTR